MFSKKNTKGSAGLIDGQGGAGEPVRIMSIEEAQAIRSQAGSRQDQRSVGAEVVPGSETKQASATGGEIDPATGEVRRSSGLSSGVDGPPPALGPGATYAPGEPIGASPLPHAHGAYSSAQAGGSSSSSAPPPPQGDGQIYNPYATNNLNPHSLEFTPNGAPAPSLSPPVLDADGRVVYSHDPNGQNQQQVYDPNKPQEYIPGVSQ